MHRRLDKRVGQIIHVMNEEEEVRMVSHMAGFLDACLSLLLIHRFLRVLSQLDDHKGAGPQDIQIGADGGVTYEQPCNI